MSTARELWFKCFTQGLNLLRYLPKKLLSTEKEVILSKLMQL